MSFMTGGAECSTAVNPLSQFAKHGTDDRSLQYERSGPQRSGSQGSAMRTGQRMMTNEDVQALQSQSQFRNISPFTYEAMRGELNGVYQGSKPPSVVTNAPANSAWGQEFQHKSPSPESWTSEFPQSASHSASQTPVNMGPRFGQGMMNMGMMRMNQMSQMGQMNQINQMNQSGQTSQAKVQELDPVMWEEQFKQIEQDQQVEDKAEKNKAAATAEDTVVVDENMEEQQFEDVWNRIKSQVLDNVEDWAGNNAWDRDYNEFTTSRPDFGDYQFEENNPYLEHDDPYTLGCSLMDTGAKLSVAALCFEAAVQRDPNHADAWNRLGAAQAQNEKEDPAIRALERCVKLDPENLTALMNLSVSYTNEGCENAAYATLEKWLATKYPDVVDKARTQEPKLGNEDRFQLHSRVTELFIRAAQLSPGGANMDADVQVGLGVLFYGNEEYQKAIDCFGAALSVRPNDPLLWNRLGATLANSNKSEEAIEAYYKALEIRPAFVRARYNLGVSCINIGCYREAAEHLLAALSLHQTDGPDNDVQANQSTNLYETLRRIFLAMERRDLVDKVGTGMDVNEFRTEFSF